MARIALNVVTLTGTYADGSGNPLFGTVTFAPSVPLTDIGDERNVLQVPVQVAVNSAGMFSVGLYATDNADFQPQGWTWQITENIAGLTPATWNFFLPYAGGATQDISALTPVAEVTPSSAYLPETGGSMSGTIVLEGSPPLKLPSGVAGDVLTSDASGNLTLMLPAASAVTSVNTRTGAVVLTAADVGADTSGAAAAAQSTAESFATSAVATETSRAEAAEAAKLPLAGGTMSGAIAMGASKITVLADGSAAQDAVAFSQLPSSSSPLAVSEGGTGTSTGAPQNEVFAGPATGGSGAPAFRSLVAADVPTLNQSTTGNAATATAAAGLETATTTVVVSGATAPTSGQVLTATSGTAADWTTPAAGVTLDSTGSDIQPLGAQAAGSVGKAADSGHVHPTTGVVLTSALPLAISSGGTGTATGAPQNDVFAGPSSGGTGAPSFRGLVAGDIPANAANTTGTAANLSGTPALPNGTTATTQTTGDSTTKLATDAFVATAVATETTRAEAAEALLAPLASPTFTGTVTVPTPSASSAAATKGYVDGVAQGLSGKYSAVAATTGSETYTIASGSVTQISGTTVDGASPSVNDYVLVKDAPAASGAGSAGSTEPGNGLYQVTSNTTNLSLSRAAAMSGSNPPAGAYVFVEGGTANASAGYVVSTPSTSAAFTYGSGNIKFTQFSGAGEITAGTGLSKSGNTVSLATDSTASDIKALGSQSAGSSGIAPNSDHVHPTTGLVTSVTAGDTSIVVGGTSAAPTLETGTLDVIAADHPPAANWSNNSHKITSLANGSASSDAAAFGQIPVADTTASDIQALGASAAAGSNGKWADSGHVHPNTGVVTGVTAGDTSIVVGGTSAAPTIETATLDVIAADHPPAANWSNNSHKITSLANGTAGSDAAAYGQTPAGGNTATIAQGGTGQTTRQTAMNALSPTATLGDTLYEDGASGVVALAGNMTATKNFLTQTGTGSASAAPAWGTLQAADLPAATTSAQGAVELDGTAGDIQPVDGASAAGSTGKAADAGHVHVGLKPSNNLSDVSSVPTALANIGMAYQQRIFAV